MARPMNRWLVYTKERFPLAVYLLLGGGMVCSGHLIAGVAATLGKTIYALAGLMLFFAELRLMDEFKDYRKDQVAHPERPLPRGLLSVDEVRRAIVGLFAAMILFGALTLALFGAAPGALYIGFSLYLWLMFKEFYLGERLSRYPLIYAVTHQIILIPICLFAVAIHAGFDLPPLAFAYSVAVLGAFFAYEVCRKLDPEAHPVLQTYLSVYGVVGTSALVLVLLCVAAFGAVSMNGGRVLLPFEALVAGSLLVLATAPRRFKLVEGAATLSLLVHLWSVPVLYYVGKFL